MSAESAKRALEALLAAAAPPPSPEVDAADVIESGARMMERRSAPFAELQESLADDPQLLKGDEECQAMVETLREIDEHWSAALQRARIIVGDRVNAMRKMKQLKGGGYSSGR